MSNDKETSSDYDDELLEAEEGEFITTSIDAASTFGGYRHIMRQSGAEPPTYSTICGRKKAPRDLRGKSCVIDDAYGLLLSKVDVCPTCRNKSGLDNHVKWGEVQRVIRGYEDGDLTEPSPEDERIPVRAEFNVEIDFPPSAKYDLIEVAREMMSLGQSLDDDLPPIEVDAVAADAPDDIPAMEEVESND